MANLFLKEGIWFHGGLQAGNWLPSFPKNAYPAFLTKKGCGALLPSAPFC